MERSLYLEKKNNTFFRLLLLLFFTLLPGGNKRDQHLLFVFVSPPLDELILPLVTLLLLRLLVSEMVQLMAFSLTGR